MISYSMKWQRIFGRSIIKSIYQSIEQRYIVFVLHESMHVPSKYQINWFFVFNLCELVGGNKQNLDTENIVIVIVDYNWSVYKVDLPIIHL